MKKARRKKRKPIRCFDCGLMFVHPRGVKVGPCEKCQRQRDLVHRLHYGNPTPLTVEQEAEERERRMTHRVGY